MTAPPLQNKIAIYTERSQGNWALAIATGSDAGTVTVSNTGQAYANLAAAQEAFRALFDPQTRLLAQVIVDGYAEQSAARQAA